MAHKEWQAIVEDWRKVPARKGDQGVESSGVRSNNKSKAGGEESRKAVRSTTQEHRKENSGV